MSLASQSSQSVWIARIALVVAAICSPIVFDYWWRGLHRHPKPPVWSVSGGQAGRGPAAFRRYGCTSCHTIPGLRDATGRVGPQLAGIGEQSYLGGVVANGPENMIAWLKNPRRFSPETAMPNLGVTDEDARDMAAYLYEFSSQRSWQWR